LDYTIKVTDVAIVTATLLGPILAVQAQKWLERHRAILERRNTIFRTLMATRAAPLSPVHVEALNAVPVEFYGNKGKLKEINESWKVFLDYHLEEMPSTDAWWQKRRELFVNLLHLISEFLRYEFTRSQLARDIYSPKLHGLIENEQTIIRQGLVKLFNGETVFPMAVKEFPATVDANMLANQAAIQQALLEWLQGQRAVQIRNTNSEDPRA
jgi:hypothetical protein